MPRSTKHFDTCKCSWWELRGILQSLLHLIVALQHWCPITAVQLQLFLDTHCLETNLVDDQSQTRTLLLIRLINQ